MRAAYYVLYFDNTQGLKAEPLGLFLDITDAYAEKDDWELTHPECHVLYLPTQNQLSGLRDVLIGLKLDI